MNLVDRYDRYLIFSNFSSIFLNPNNFFQFESLLFRFFRCQPQWRRSFRRDDELESNDRSASSLAFESGRSRLCELHSRSCISKVEKERLSLTTPVSGMKALAQIGAWHNPLDRMPAVILVSPLLNYYN